MASKKFTSLSHQHPGLWLTGILLIAVLLRLTNLTASSLWLDEIYSLMTANVHLRPNSLEPAIHTARWTYEHYLAWQPMHWPSLLTLLKSNVHMPLYYLLLNPWLGYFGNDVFGLRSFSALFSVLLIIPVYLLGRSMAGNRAGLLAAFIVAVNPFQLYYAQEGRMYTLTMFWSALSTLALWKTLFADKPIRWSLLYALSVAGGSLSHYMFLFCLGFQTIFSLSWLSRTRNWRRFALLGIAFLVLVGLAIWWWPVYQMQQHGVNNEYHFAKSLVSRLRYPTALIWQPMVMLAGDNRLERLFYLPLLTLLLIWQGLRRFQGRSKAPEQKQLSSSDMEALPRSFWRQNGFLLAWLFIPLLLQIAYDFLKHTHISVIDRYTLLGAPALYLLFGLLLDRLATPVALPEKSHATARWLPALLALLLLLGIANVWAPSPFRDEHNKRDVQVKLAYMTEHAAPDELLLSNGPFGVQNLAAYYLMKLRPDQPILYWIDNYQGKPVSLPSKALLKSYPRVWLFRYRANNKRGLQAIKDHLLSLYPSMEKTNDWFIYSPKNAPPACEEVCTP